MRQTFSLSILLVIFWLLNSGHYTPLLLSLGAVSIVVVILITQRMDAVDGETQPVRLTLKFFAYQLWLLKQITLANIAVVKHIWLGSQSISPTMATLKVSQATDLGKVIYAGSITLTPGTVVMELEDDQLLVHALLRENIAVLQAGEMDRRVTELDY